MQKGWMHENTRTYPFAQIKYRYRSAPNYLLDSSLFLNLSTRPPLSTNFCLPV